MALLNRILITLWFCFTSLLLSAQALPDPSYRLVQGNSHVQSKNYYLLTLFQENKDVKKLLESDPALQALAAGKVNALSASLQECTGRSACFTERMKFSDQEIRQVGERLQALYADGNALGKLVQQHLVPSGAYVLFAKQDPRKMLVQAWEQDASGINFTIGVYAEGMKANYPNIDSASLLIRSPQYPNFLHTAAYLIGAETRNNQLFFALPLASALHFLEMNERDQAADFEPMASTVNKAAYDRVKSIKWDAYKYSVILVPGAGPDDPSVALSAEAMLRCRLGAVQYVKGMAPFIVVSGGKVHPYKTRYCEATEMKNFLVNKLHIPEHAVIVDPHARHTTTNMRNCARLIFRYGIPFTKAGLATTSRGQSTAITTTLPARCEKELHLIPYRNGARLSETESEFFPLIEALHINPTEPIDP